MSRLLAMAVPIAAGKDAEWHQFIRELKDNRLEEFQASRRKLGVRERTFYQETPMGGLVLVTLEGDNPEEALRQFAQGKDAFTQWFMEKVKATHDIDLAAIVQSPLPQMLLDSGMVEAPAAQRV